MTGLAAIGWALAAAGCTSPGEYIRNGFKVGPNYCPPTAPVAPAWIDAADRRVRIGEDDLAGWWTVLNDPLLDGLVMQAYSQNLTLREAGFRILQAQAQLGFAIGNVFPQEQTASGGFRHFGVGNSFFDTWNLGFNLAWELDFWGRFRRAVDAAQDGLDASVNDYDDVLVTLLADVASNYVRYRTAEERIRLLEKVIAIQEDVLTFITERLQAGAIIELDRAQAASNLKQSQAQLAALRVVERVAQNQLCILLGMPVADLSGMLDEDPKATIPVTPDFVVVGIPADLLRRRPDVRRAERLAAAQAEQIGIAEADLYPAFAITGTLGWQASSFPALFSSNSLNSNVGPIFNWNLLNYGRIRNNVRFQDARFRELVTAYQSAALNADLEVENGIVNFLQAQDRAVFLRDSVDESYRALQIIVAQYRQGVAMAQVDFNRYAVIQQNLISQQDLWAQRAATSRWD